MPKISVIVPVFNSEKYLKQCLDSLINQTLKDIQIICIDNLSTDFSPQIIKEYTLKDDRFLMVNCPNDLRLGSARNYAMQYATGDYIHFLDSDDWMESDAYEKLVNETTDNPDVVCFLWNNIDLKNKTVRPEYYVNSTKYGNFNETPAILDNLGISVWHRIYKKEFLDKNNLNFNDYPCFEDVEFIYKIIILAEKIKFIDEHLINYRINNPNSLVGKAYKNSKYIINTYNTIYEFSRMLSAERRDYLLSHLLNSVMYRVTGSYVFGFLSFEELNDFVSNIDYSVFLNDKNTYKWYKFYKEITRNPKFLIKIKYLTKLFLKNNFYSVYEILKNNTIR